MNSTLERTRINPGQSWSILFFWQNDCENRPDEINPGQVKKTYHLEPHHLRHLLIEGKQRNQSNNETMCEFTGVHNNNNPMIFCVGVV